MMLSYCADLVRRHDNDRFVTALFAPQHRREALFALYAFNHEIAKTREVVTETRLGLIRLQWWRDEIARIFESRQASPHEVLEPLAAAIHSYGLPREDFDLLAYGREFDLEDMAPQTMDGMLRYADVTAAPLYRLAARILGADIAEDAQKESLAALAAGYALIGILRAVPVHARQHRILLPSQEMARHNIRTGEIFNLKPPEALKAFVCETAAIARQKLQVGTGERLRGQKALAPLLLSGTLAGMHLKTLARARYDVFSPRVQQRPFLREARLYLALLSGRF